MMNISKLKKLPNQSQDRSFNSPENTRRQEQVRGRESAEIVANRPGTQPADTVTSNPTIISVSGQTYSRFDTVEDVVNQQKETVTSGLWSGNAGTLSTFFTSSAQTVSQKRHYVDIFNADTSDETREVQFALAYGHAEGSGSSKLGTEENPASKAVYSQYKQLLLNKTANRFVTAGSGSTDSIYAVNIQRARQKEKLDYGNWEIPLKNITAHDTNATGSVTLGSSMITLIDDSTINTSGTNTEAGIVYNIVSGSVDNGVFQSADPIYYGLFYPLHGVMILDGKMLDQQLGFSTNVSSSSSTTAEGNNHYLLYHSISGSAAGSGGNIGFEARNEQEITSTHYFVRVKNGSFNFSNNPSYVSGSVGDFKNSSFVGNPKAYITTVGLYNDKNELLAIAKLSKPLLKSFSREALLRVKLDF